MRNRQKQHASDRRTHVQSEAGITPALPCVFDRFISPSLHLQIWFAYDDELCNLTYTHKKCVLLLSVRDLLVSYLTNRSSRW